MNNRAIQSIIAFGILVILAATPAPTLANPSDPPLPPYLRIPIEINEVSFYSAPGVYEWIELRNVGDTETSAKSLGMTDEDGHWYYFPDRLPPVPPGDFVLVIFDGQGGALNDYDFTDHLAVLHSPRGLVDIFEDRGDQCALYEITYHLHLPLAIKGANNTSQTLEATPPPFLLPDQLGPAPVIDFVAWGRSTDSSEDFNAAWAGVWSYGRSVNLDRGLGFYEKEHLIEPYATIALIPDSTFEGPDAWAYYQAREATKGKPNVFRGINWTRPVTDLLRSEDLPADVWWSIIPGARYYRVQVDDQPDFSSPEMDNLMEQGRTILDLDNDLPIGTYYWHVKVIYPEGESDWSPGIKITLNDEVPPSPSPPPLMASPPLTGSTIEKILGVPCLPYQKDTNMLCFLEQEYGVFAWDIPHSPSFADSHIYYHCSHAMIANLVAYYGGHLSQDRIGYQAYLVPPNDWDEKNYLGHERGMEREQLYTVLEWALGEPFTVLEGRPSFESLKEWIDTGHPIVAFLPSHVNIIDGYRIEPIAGKSFQWLHQADTPYSKEWVRYSQTDLVRIVPAPALDDHPLVKSDEDEDRDGIFDTVDDSDQDGICDFDEIHRFHTDPLNPDSDQDGVPDKQDLREYVFTYFGKTRGGTADIDGDGLAKELDPNNDVPGNGGLEDGEEDLNHNGVYELYLNETFNFSALDDYLPNVTIDIPKNGHDNGYNCIILVRGVVTSVLGLAGPILLETTNGSTTHVYTLTSVILSPHYFFRQYIDLYGGPQDITVTARNLAGFGWEHITVLATCE